MAVWEGLCFSRHAVSVGDCPRTLLHLLTALGSLESCSCSWQMAALSSSGTSRGRLVPRRGSKQAHYDALCCGGQNRWKRICIKMAGDRLKLSTRMWRCCQGKQGRPRATDAFHRGSHPVYPVYPVPICTHFRLAHPLSLYRGPARFTARGAAALIGYSRGWRVERGEKQRQGLR